MHPILKHIIMKKSFFFLAILAILCACDPLKTPQVSISHEVNENNTITFVATHKNAILFVWWVNDIMVNQEDIGYDTLVYQGSSGNSYVAKLRYYDSEYNPHYAKDSVYIP